MARPRIFVSSTFFDLRQVRADIERFIREMGYDPILHEKGHIPYGSHDKLEEYCYREIELSDIVVCVVGGRYALRLKMSRIPLHKMNLRKQSI